MHEHHLIILSTSSSSSSSSSLPLSSPTSSPFSLPSSSSSQSVSQSVRQAGSQLVRPARLAASPFRAQARNFIQTLHAHRQPKIKKKLFNGGSQSW